MTLDQGNFKVYDWPGMGEWKMEVFPDGGEDGWTHLRTRVWTGGNIFSNLTRRYSVDAEGNVWFFGVVQEMEQPAEPVLMVDAPLYEGKAWEQIVDYPGYPSRHFSHVCEAQEFVTVPYGTFWCDRVRHTMTEGRDVTERIFWYCDGIGRVKIQQITPEPSVWELADDARIVIPVENTTWGAVKSLYR